MKKITLLVAAIAILLTSCNGGMRYRKASGKTWGTFYHIIYKADCNLDDSIEAVMAAIDKSLSPFKEGSVIDSINKGQSDDVDLMFTTVFNRSKDINRVSGGLFDPTIAPLVNLWGFGYKDGDKQPDDVAITRALTLVGIDSCSIVDGKIVKKSPGTEFNFSAIAKGYGCDCVAAMLKRNGCIDYLVEIGGEIALSGYNPKGEKWHVQVDAPVDGLVHKRAALIQLTDCGVASSGNYRNYRDTGEGRVGHTISPKTGRPYATSLLGVTIIAPDCMTADGLATACMAMTLEEASKMIDGLPRVNALFITEGDEMITTSGFPTLE